MKDKWKNLSKALIIAVIVTGIFTTAIYYTVCETILKPINELQEEMESMGAGSRPITADDVEIQDHPNILFGIIISSIGIFCITTLVSYMIIERLRKRKN